MSDLLDELAGVLPAAPAQRGESELRGIRSELAGYVTEMKRLSRIDGEDAMEWLSSVSARVLELIYFTLANEGRLMTKLRVEELIPFREELRFQFQVASRRVAMMKMEWDFARGQET